MLPAARLNIRNNPAGQFDGALYTCGITNVTAQGFPRSALQRRCSDEAVPRECGNIVAVLAGESPDLAHRQIQRREQPDIENGCIAPFKQQWYGILVGIFVEQTQRVVVLPVEVQEARSTVRITIGNLEIFRQGNATREYRVDSP